MIFRKGMVDDALKLEPIPERIAVLRLDTVVRIHSDQTGSAVPRLSQGGILILDDYGSWLGSKRAVDEYFRGNPPLVIPTDRASRMAARIT